MEESKELQGAYKIFRAVIYISLLVELKEDEASYFELTVRPTFDLYQSLLAQADQIEVLEPASVRNEMRNFAKNLMSYYKEERQ